MFFLIVELWRKYKKESLLAPSFKLIESLLELSVPLLISNLVDFGIMLKDYSYIIKITFLLLTIALISIIISSIAQFFSAKAAAFLSSDLRSRLMKNILYKTSSELDQYSGRELLTYLLSDCNNVQNGINLMLRLLLRSPFVVIGSIILAFKINARLAFIFIPCIILLSLIITTISKATLPLFDKIQKIQEGILYFLQDHINGLKIFRSMNLQNIQILKFKDKVYELKSSQHRLLRLNILLGPITYVIINLSIIVLLFSGSNLISRSKASTGQVFALYNYFAGILLEMIKLVNLLIIMSRANSSAKRIEKIIQSPSSDEIIPERAFYRKNNEIKTSGSKKKFKIEADNISFAYPGNDNETLKNLSFTFETGDFIGIIGSTASGKSTLLKLMAGLYDSDLIVNGKKLLDYDKNTYDLYVSYVRQTASLFKGTIRENLYIASGIDDDLELRTALEEAEAIKFVDANKLGIDHSLIRSGLNLSGGQRQRLSLARALIKSSPILLLDDVCSALDYASEKRIIKRLSNRKNCLTVLVSQRISSLIYCNKILLMDKGRIIDQGSHQDLLGSSDIYKQIYMSQFPDDPRFKNEV